MRTHSTTILKAIMHDWLLKITLISSTYVDVFTSRLLLIIFSYMIVLFNPEAHMFQNSSFNDGDAY